MRSPGPFVLLLVAGCSAATVPSAATLWDASASSGAQLVIAGDEIVEILVPARLEDVPAAVRFVAESIQPDGVLELVARERGPRGTGWRFVKDYSDQRLGRRTLLIDAGGVVLERTHEVPRASAPAAVLDRARTVAAGNVVRIEVVQADRETWRVSIEDPDARSYRLLCLADGETLRVERLLTALVAAVR